MYEWPTLEESREAYSHMRPTDLRRAAQGDLYFLLRWMLNRPDMAHPWLYDRCREVQKHPDGYLDLWAREHYKSTIITFALTIQEILNNPEITIGIFSHTRSIAKTFLMQIKREMENNQALNDCFPDILWGAGQRGQSAWNDNDGLIVRRRGNPKEATVEAWGLVDGQPTGKHFDLVVYDDVVTRESVTTPEQIEKVTAAWELSLNLGAKDGRRRYIGTRYHYNDTYKTIMDRHAAIPRIYPATEDGTDTGRPVLLSPGNLARKRQEMGPYTFGCQMLQDPRADASAGFLEKWFAVGGAPTAEQWLAFNRYIVVDPAGEKKKNSDYTVMWVIGLGPDQNYHVLDGVRDRLNLTERASALFALHRRWAPNGVGYEKYGMQADVEYIRERQEREKYYFGIVELGGALAKNDRIRRMVPLFEGGRVIFPHVIDYVDRERRRRNLTADFKAEEYLAFPVSAHDDMLDCLSRIIDPEMGASFPRPASFAGHGQRRAIQRMDI